jgi:glucose-6-phosphate 1-dehydrogenase
MRPIDPADVVRGQFDGYHQEQGVSPQSIVETFAVLRLFVESDRWRGVPFYLRAGKCLPVTCTEVLVKLKRPNTAPSGRVVPGRPNYLRFRLGPEQIIAMGVQAKAPGDAIVGQHTELVAHHQPAGDEAPYERLLWHASQGDKLVFASEKTIEGAWRVLDPILHVPTPLHSYKPGTWGPSEADRLIAADGGWDNPTPADLADEAV